MTLTLPLKIESFTRIKSPAAKMGLLGASAAAFGLYEKILLSIVPLLVESHELNPPLSNFAPPAREIA